MTSIYVREQGAQIRRSGERLVVSKQGSVLDEFPLADVEQVVLMGNVQLTAQAAALLLAHEIDVVYLSTYGKFRGRLVGSGSKHARLRQQQMAAANNPAVALNIARAMVDGKIHNQRVVLQRQARRPGDAEMPANGRADGQTRFERALQGMVQMRQAANKAENMDALRGYEGKAAAHYFDAVRSLLEPDWGFERRDYYPPPDPFNALLSFCYSLLLKDVLAAVNLVGFDPYQGFFHEITYGRPSLALDLMEEWRPLVADSLALELVNRGSLRPEAFVRTRNPRRPVELGEAGMQRVLRGYGQRLEMTVYHPLAGPGGNTPIRHAIVLQARRLARVVDGRTADYEAFKAR